jgi:hypothetical protein
MEFDTGEPFATVQLSWFSNRLVFVRWTGPEPLPKLLHAVRWVGRTQTYEAR